MKGDFTRLTFRPQNHYSAVPMQQGRVQLDADWNEAFAIQDYRTRIGMVDLIGLTGAPEGSAAFGILTSGMTAPDKAAQDLLAKLKHDDFLITPGRFYAEGVLVANDGYVPFSAQPGAAAIGKGGLYIIYLDVWQRLITALEAPAIREDALGGPDTATRTRTEWRVCALPVKQQNEQMPSCGATYQEWTDLTGPRKAGLTARTRPGKTADDPCIIAAAAGYRRLENQLYRVEIHKAGGLGTATFKWSRDNGSVLLKVDGITGTKQVEVSAPGREIGLMVGTGQWVELIDEHRELTGQPGAFATIDQVGDGRLILANLEEPLANFDKATLRLRRWDGVAKVEQGAAQDDLFLPLESGVEVKFAAGGDYRTGDYWLIPARTLKADIEWPQASPGNPQELPPLGKHIYCKLGLVQVGDGAANLLSDCRPTFAPIADRRFRVLDVQLNQEGATPLRFDQTVQDAQLADGISVICERNIGTDPAALQRACFVKLQIPYLVDVAIFHMLEQVLFRGQMNGFRMMADTAAPNANEKVQPVAITPQLLQETLAANPLFGAAAVGQPQLPNLGYHEVILAAHVETDSGRIIWRGDDLQTVLRVYFIVMQWLQLGNTLDATLTVKGNAISAEGDPEAYLDAEAFEANQVGADNLRRPTGNGRRGGDLELWFMIGFGER